MTERGICPPDHKHGETSTCYLSHRCGCDDCLNARTEYQFWRRGMLDAGREHLFNHPIDGTGVRRRLQALMAIGYSARRIGERLNVTGDQVLIWMTRDRVLESTHARVAALYEQLADHPPTPATSGDRVSINRARNQAALRGYARPIDWDDIDTDEAPGQELPVAIDEIAIALAVDGQKVKLTRAERHVAVTTLNRDRGYNDQVIARMLGVADKTIERDREYLGLPAAVGPDKKRIAA